MYIKFYSSNVSCFQFEPSNLYFVSLWWGLNKLFLFQVFERKCTLHPEMMSWPQWLGAQRSHLSPMVLGGQMHWPVLASQLFPTWLQSQAVGRRRKQKQVLVKSKYRGKLFSFLPFSFLTIMSSRNVSKCVYGVWQLLLSHVELSIVPYIVRFLIH